MEWNIQYQCPEQHWCHWKRGHSVIMKTRKARLSRTKTKTSTLGRNRREVIEFLSLCKTAMYDALCVTLGKGRRQVHHALAQLQQRPQYLPGVKIHTQTFLFRHLAGNARHWCSTSMTRMHTHEQVKKNLKKTILADITEILMTKVGILIEGCLWDNTAI